MTEKELVKKEILYMQIRLFRMAQKKWNLSPERCADIFERLDIDRYIRETYGIFHVQGDEANLLEIEQYVAGKGVTL